MVRWHWDDLSWVQGAATSNRAILGEGGGYLSSKHLTPNDVAHSTGSALSDHALEKRKCYQPDLAWLAVVEACCVHVYRGRQTQPGELCSH